MSAEGSRRGLVGWLDDRGGVGRLIGFARDQSLKPVPRGLSWAYTLGTLALFFFGLQFLTGFLLLAHYAPHADVAYDTVQSIQHRAHLGWLVRQMHSWGASFIIIVLIFHILKVLWFGSYKRPREFTWFVGFLLLAVTLTFCFTGYILPWNQLGRWATAVGSGGVSKIPGIGEPLAELVLGGEEVSGNTLGRFFAVHVFLLPTCLGLLVLAHLVLIRWKGITPKVTVTDELDGGYDEALESSTGGEPFFPRQAYRELLVCLVGFALLVTAATLWPWHLGEPASNQTPEHIKPEWYFLPIYQFFKLFDQDLVDRIPLVADLGLPAEFVGILAVNLCALILFLLPILDRGKQRRILRRPFFSLLALVALAAIVLLGLMGYVSEREFTIGERTYYFDIRGFPAEPPPEPEEQQEEMVEESPDLAAVTRPDGRLLGGSCGGCHDQRNHERARRNWLQSVHAAQDEPRECSGCHGGLDMVDDEEVAHHGMLTDDDDEWRAPEGDEIVEICGRCHGDVREHYLAARVDGARSDGGGDDAETSAHLALEPRKTCYNCHGNHKVLEATVALYDPEATVARGTYRDGEDPRTAPYREIGDRVGRWEKERQALLEELDAARRRLVEEHEYPVELFDKNVLIADQAQRQVGVVAHSLDVGLVSEAIEGARSALVAALEPVRAQLKSIEDRRYLVLAIWGMTLICALPLLLKLRSLRKLDREPEEGNLTGLLDLESAPRLADEDARELESPDEEVTEIVEAMELEEPPADAAPGSPPRKMEEEKTDLLDFLDEPEEEEPEEER